MALRFAWRRTLSAVPIALLAVPLLAHSQQARAPGGTSPAASGKLLVAVLELEAVDVSKSQASAITDRLREELLRSQKYTLVDRELLNQTMQEQALQQTGCTTQDCAVQVGKILGVRKMITGRVTGLGPDRWQLSAMMVDVETSATDRAESIRYRGDIFGMLDDAVVQLARKLAAPDPAQAAAGGIRIATNAPKTRVYDASDNKLLGTAGPRNPLTVNSLPAGGLALRLEADGYLAANETVTITAGATAEANLVLQLAQEAGAEEWQPKRGFSLMAGAYNVSGTFKPDKGSEQSFSAPGAAIGLDYQWVISRAVTLAAFAEVGGGQVSGDLKSAYSNASAMELGAEVRYWLNRYFVGAHLGAFSTTFTATSSQQHSLQLSGGGGGLTAGYEWDKGWYLRGSLAAASLDNKSSSDSAVPKGTARETQALLSAGYRWK